MSTPDPQARISKRRYDGQVRAWRRFLHKYDDTSDAHGTEDFTAELAAEAEDVAPEKETDSGEGAAAAASNELCVVLKDFTNERLRCFLCRSLNLNRNASAQPSKSTDDAFESIKDVLYGEGDLDEVLDLL